MVILRDVELVVGAEIAGDLGFRFRERGGAAVGLLRRIGGRSGVVISPHIAEVTIDIHPPVASPAVPAVFAP